MLAMYTYGSGNRTIRTASSPLKWSINSWRTGQLAFESGHSLHKQYLAMNWTGSMLEEKCERTNHRMRQGERELIAFHSAPQRLYTSKSQIRLRIDLDWSCPSLSPVYSPTGTDGTCVSSWASKPAAQANNKRATWIILQNVGLSTTALWQLQSQDREVTWEEGYTYGLRVHIL